MMRQVLPQELHLDSLPLATKRAFLACTKFEWLMGSAWYLAGGTALALQTGHRRSVDLDFFTETDGFSGLELETKLTRSGPWSTVLSEAGTLYGLFEEAKMSFIAYPFFRPGPIKLQCGAVTLAMPSDIAAMKIIAVSQRGKKRDFVDLYWLAHNGVPLSAALLSALNQYPGQKHNVPHFLKSLVYFKEAEEDPMPEVFFSVGWPAIKAYFRKEVPELAATFLGLES